MKTRILVFIPVYKRAEIVEKCYDRLALLQTYDRKRFNIDVLVVHSLDEDKKLAARYGFKSIFANNFPLGNKKNIGLKYALTYKWDYLLEMDSNGVILPELIDLYQKEFEAKTPFFGVNRIAFYDIKTKRLLDYSICNGGVWVTGRCIRRDIVEKTAYRKQVMWKATTMNKHYQYKRGEVSFWPEHLINERQHKIVTGTRWVALWDGQKPSGLGVDQEDRIQQATGKIVKIINTKKPLILDIKSEMDVTDFETLVKHPKEARLVTQGREKILKQFQF